MKRGGDTRRISVNRPRVTIVLRFVRPWFSYLKNGVRSHFLQCTCVLMRFPSKKIRFHSSWNLCVNWKNIIKTAKGVYNRYIYNTGGGVSLNNSVNWVLTKFFVNCLTRADSFFLCRTFVKPSLMLRMRQHWSNLLSLCFFCKQGRLQNKNFAPWDLF